MTAISYFVIGKSGVEFTTSSSTAAERYAEQRALLCSGAVDSELLQQLSTAASTVSFVSDPVPDLGHRWIEKPARVGAAIELALNRPALLEWLRAVTGCQAAGRIEGRLVETRAGSGDRLDWHDDQMPNAQFGLSLHLRACNYDGGGFELRDSANKAELFRHANAEAGDLVIFEVSPRSQHRVTPVISGAARLVFTGWYMADASAT